MSGLFQISPQKPCMHLSFTPYVPHAPHISSLLIWSPECYLVRSIDHKAPHYAISSNPVILPPSQFSKTLSLSSSLNERPSFTPIQNNRQNYSSVYFNLDILDRTGIKFLDWITGGPPWVEYALNFFTNAIFICLGCQVWHLSKGFIMYLRCCDYVLHYVHETFSQHLLLYQSSY